MVDPGTVDLTVNTADLNVTINGVSYATTDGNNYTAKLNPSLSRNLQFCGFW